MKTTLIRWLVLVIGVWVATIIPGIDYMDWQSLLIAALVLSILNTFIKPLLMLISVPFIIVTLGFFLLLINALLLKLTAWLVPGFYVTGFWSTLAGSLIISIISLFFGGKKHNINQDNHYNGPVSYPGHKPPPGKGPIIDV